MVILDFLFQWLAFYKLIYKVRISKKGLLENIFEVFWEDFLKMIFYK